MTKNILITGSTDGIGKLAANKMAKAGHQLYLHGRNESKLETVISELKRTSGNDHIEGFVADFSDLVHVQQMAYQIIEEVSSIDVVINNAGIYDKYTPNVKGNFDSRLIVNYFAPFLLTTIFNSHSLFKTNARVINVSSAGQASVSLDFLNGRSSINVHQAYSQSKLALIMWSFYLAKNQPNINVNSINPGSLLNTKMAQQNFGIFRNSAEKGANILYDFAVSQTYEGISGKYYDNDKGNFAMAHADAYDEKIIESLIHQTTLIINKLIKDKDVKIDI